MTFNLINALTMPLGGSTFGIVLYVSGVVRKWWAIYAVGVMVGILTILCGIIKGE